MTFRRFDRHIEERFIPSYIIKKNDVVVGNELLYLTVQVFRTSFRGARRPLAREPDVHLYFDITETNLSIDFSAISE